MTRSIILGLALAATLSPSLVHAQGWQKDRRELAQDRRESMDDHFDYMRLRELLGRFDQARATNHFPALRQLEGELRALLDEELRESHHELQKDHAELARSQREVERARWGGGRRGGAHRDRNDDIRDAQSEAWHLQQKRVIAAELSSVAGRLDPAALAYRRERIARLLTLGGQEIRENQREAREDRRDGREGRRR